ncbi:MAG: hypothetical protein QG662_1501 [Pseudomonadota bacterium]|nr:hypothetical protein [Pseudomonadota bacterium]
MAMTRASATLDKQINDYLLTASGHLKDSKPLVDGQQMAAFGVAASSALAMMSQAEAAVVANAGTPQPVTVAATSGTSFASFDMNGDAVNDFALFGYFSSTSSVSAGINGTQPGGSNAALRGTSYNDVRKLASGASIGPTPSAGVTWVIAGGTGADVFFEQSNGASNWSGVNGETGFAGVRFNIGANTHYGWIQLRVNAPGSLTALSWAYEDCPDTPIQAGATTGSLCAAPTPVPVMAPVAYGLTSLALGGLGLAGLRRRREALKAEQTRH